MRIVHLSDTHGRHGGLSIPGGDVLVHTGDFCIGRSLDEVREFGTWLARARFPGRGLVILALRASMAVPTVFVGVRCFALFSRQPPALCSNGMGGAMILGPGNHNINVVTGSGFSSVGSSSAISSAGASAIITW